MRNYLIMDNHKLPACNGCWSEQNVCDQRIESVAVQSDTRSTAMRQTNQNKK